MQKTKILGKNKLKRLVKPILTAVVVILYFYLTIDSKFEN